MRLVPLSEARLIVIFDFSCLAYRAFYSKAKNQGSSLVERILIHLAPFQGIDTSVVMALDSLFLNKTTILPHYKANRIRPEENPKEKFLGVIDALPLYQIQTSGEEADDVICSFIKQNEGRSMVVITGDSDLIHLMDRPNVMVINEQSANVWTDNKYLKANYLKLSQISAFKTLFGDASDNVKPIWPRLKKKNFEDVIWLHSHDKKIFIEKTMEALKDRCGLTEPQIAIAKSNLYSNYELVIPRFNLTIDMKEPDHGNFNPLPLLSIDPSLFFLTKFFQGQTTTEPIYER